MFLFLNPAFSFLKKAFLVVAVFFIVITLFSNFIGKDKIALSSTKSDPIKQNRIEIYKVINDKELNKTQQGKLTIAVYKTSMCIMLGEACTKNPADADKNYGKSFFGFVGNLIAMPYSNPPASGIAWVSDSLQQAGFIPKTMAAEGIGFAAIKPFSNLWKIFRDLSYMLLVVILIAIGFMVMFRTKINPQTVISVENALPKIVISLILITFSFAIAGFMIDLMYVLIVLIISILSKNPDVHIDVQTYQNAFLGGNSWFIFSKLGNIWGIGEALLSFLPTIARIIFTVIVAFITSFLVQGIPVLGDFFTGDIGKFSALGNWTKNAVEAIFKFPIWVIILFLSTFILLPAVISLFVWFTVIFLFFRITFLLFKSYIEIILLIIFSPILLLFEAIPGKNVFGWWLKNLLGDLISFPLVICFMLIATILIESSNSGANIWSPPLLPQMGSAYFGTLIGIGIMFLIPDFIKLIKEAIGLKPLPIQVGLGTYFGGTSAAVGGGLGLLGQVGSISLGLSALSGDQGIGKLFKEGVSKLRRSTPNAQASTSQYDK
ncbi:MAG: hypothetical protein WC744_03900 [Patescibacteria group bacterium]|jgi:hypothetical protein